MSIEERADKHWEEYEYPLGNLYQNVFKDGYVLGANEQQKIDVEKAYFIFKELLDECYAEKDGTEKYLITFEQFKQAMDEQK